MSLRSFAVTACLLTAVAGLAGCQFNSYVYRPDVHQGNLVTKEMTEQLEIGMGRQQVLFLLGEPLVQSQLHRNRWDYIYYSNPRYGAEEARRLTLYFDESDRLAKIESDVLPTEQQADEMILGRETDFVPQPMPERRR